MYSGAAPERLEKGGDNRPVLAPRFSSDDDRRRTDNRERALPSPEIGEALRFRFVTQGIGLQAHVDLALLEQPRRVGEPPTASTFTSFESEPAGLGDIGDEERGALVHRHHADGLSLEVGKRLDLGLRDDEVQGPLGDAGDDPKRAALCRTRR